MYLVSSTSWFYETRAELFSLSLSLSLSFSLYAFSKEQFDTNEVRKFVTT